MRRHWVALLSMLGLAGASISGQSQVVKGTPNPGTKAKVAPSNTTGQAATQSSAANGNLKLKQQTLRQQNRPGKTTGSLTPPPPGQADPALTPPPPGQAGHHAVTKGNGTAVTKGNGNTAVTKGSGSAAVTKGGSAAITKGNAAVTKGAQSSAVTKGSAASKTAVTKGQTGSPQR